MREWVAGDPLVIERGEGVRLYDTEGRAYYDGVSSLWLNLHGHRVPRLDAAVRAQLDRLAHSTFLGLTHPPGIRLAEELLAIAPPGLARVFYSDNGATAAEIAVKMAFQYWRHRGELGRTRFVTLENAYHGDTIGAVSVGGVEIFHAIFRPLLFQVYRAPSPYCYRCLHNGESPAGCRQECLTGMEEILARHPGEIAAAIVEPRLQGAGGMIAAPDGFLRGVRELTRRYDVLLIADEVATGFGRTGRMFACEHEDVSPDLMCLAKGITGGYLPLAATLATEEIYEAFLGEHSEMKTFFHGHSYTANPLACAVAIANLEIFREEGVIEGLPPKIELIRERLAAMRHLPFVGDVRQAGFMCGIELVRDKKTKEPFPVEERAGAKVCQAARERGLLIRPLSDVVVFMPPLGSSPAELGEMLEILAAALRCGDGEGN